MSEHSADPDPTLVAARMRNLSRARSPLSGLAGLGAESLAVEDPELHQLICACQRSDEATISLSAASGIVDPAVNGAMASFMVTHDLSADEFPSVKRLATDRATRAFGARRAYPVQSDVTSVVSAVCGPATTLIAPSGMHEQASVHYPRGDSALLRDAIREQRPDVILCDAISVFTAREPADQCGAILICDISEAPTLVSSGIITNPVNVADLTILSTSGQLGGPSGSLVLLGERRMREALLRTLPKITSNGPTLAGIARALESTREPHSTELADRMLRNSRHIANELSELGYPVDPARVYTPIVELDPTTTGPPAYTARRILRELNIVVDEQYERLRLCVQAVTQRGFGPIELREIARLIHDTLSATTEHPGQGWLLDEFTRLTVGEAVLRLVRQFPLPRHVPASYWSENP